MGAWSILLPGKLTFQDERSQVQSSDCTNFQRKAQDIVILKWNRTETLNHELPKLESREGVHSRWTKEYFGE